MADVPDLPLLNLAQLVPERYSAYRPLVQEAAWFFLSRLSPSRREAIVAEQAQLPIDCDLEDRALALLLHCPTLHKLGQVLARDRRLSAELRNRLRRLESPPPVTPLAAIVPSIRRELGNEGNITIADHALAEASVAVVVPFTRRDAVSGSTQEGVFKVLKPGIEERLHEELNIWPRLGEFLEERSRYYGLPAVDYAETLSSVQALLANEIRLENEQAHLAQAGEVYASVPEVRIPRLLPYSTARMTAMERVRGGKVTDAAGLSPVQRQRLAAILVDALLAKPFWSDTGDALLHADPHAGNLFLADDGRLAIFDWSLAVPLSKARRLAMMQIVLGALSLDVARICTAVSELASVPPPESSLRATVEEALGQVRWGTFPGLDWLQNLLDRLVVSGGVRFPEELVLFRKALLTLTAVVEDVAPSFSPDQVLFSSGVTRFMQELPGRLRYPASDHTYGAHVSNPDLLSLMAAWPLVATRCWIDNWQDILSKGAVS